MGIKCCTHCVPPKRHSGCHSTCPEYTKEKAEHNREKAETRKLYDYEKDANDYEVNRLYQIKKKTRVR